MHKSNLRENITIKRKRLIVQATVFLFYVFIFYSEYASS